MKYNVLVLMATYNGQKYLREQIDSILRQKFVNLTILISDDFSTDETMKILNEYKNNHSNIYINQNKRNLGFTYNFINLIYKLSNDKYDYYALSDQDDVWEDLKLIKAIESINKSKHNNGCLYCSNLKVVDSKLNFIEMQENTNVLNIKRYSYLVNNIATGCTIVFDSKFYKHIITKYPTKIYLHDYWLLLIAVYTADFKYDLNSYIKYRQHINNQIGSNKKGSLNKKIKRFLHPIYRTSDLVAEFYRQYNDFLADKDKKYLNIVSNYRRKFSYKIKLLFSTKIVRRKLNLLFKLKILLNKY